MRRDRQMAAQLAELMRAFVKSSGKKPTHVTMSQATLMLWLKEFRSQPENLQDAVLGVKMLGGLQVVLDASVPFEQLYVSDGPLKQENKNDA